MIQALFCKTSIEFVVLQTFYCQNIITDKFHDVILQLGSKMTDIISWDKAIDKKVKSSDDKNLGKIQSVTRDYIQTKEGTVDKKYYYIPKFYLQGYDGDHLWVSLTRNDVK